MDIEKYLKNAFDYQRFRNDPDLAKLIAETEKRSSKALSDDDLNMVSAAGDFLASNSNRKDSKNS